MPLPSVVNMRIIRPVAQRPAIDHRDCRGPLAWARRASALLLLAGLALLSGCSLLRLTYPQVPTLAYWWLDGYVDFTTAQTPKVQEQLADWLRWHRATQLPEYVTLLQRARVDVLANTTPAQVCRWYDDIAAQAMTAYAQALPAAAEVALALTPAQLEHMQHKFDKTNVEFRDDYLQASLEKRTSENVKRAVERAETLYGKLDDAQRELIAREIAGSPFDAARWLAEREVRQREVLQTLRRLQAAQASSAQMQAALRSLAEQVQLSPRPAYRDYQQRLKTYTCAFAARVHNATTPAQRQAAADTIKGWEADLRALAAEPPR